jgi:hypothetical protein
VQVDSTVSKLASANGNVSAEISYSSIGTAASAPRRRASSIRRPLGSMPTTPTTSR